ncbi:hypothetical protein [Lewinella cohaerens]|uniref:hypothetical protein n=1 Tax=Lewinella cohaerens TaxID=70995 RepID=UPI00036FA2FE|nr:hypothetical protein [Lewinella cohaerens]
MTKNLDDRKYKIIQELIKTEDENLIIDLENRLAQDQEVTSHDQIWDMVIRPMRKNVSVKELAEEQNYKPLDRDHFFSLTQEVSIEED